MSPPVINKTVKPKRNVPKKKQAQVNAPAALGSVQRNKGPQISMRNGRTVIKHRELLKRVTSATTFFSSSNRINPGIESTFDWLSGRAVGWEKYVFRKLSVEYVGRTGSATSGTVGLSFDYDTLDLDPVTEREFYANNGSVECAPWQRVACAANRLIGRELFVRAGHTSTAGMDLKTYDAGKVIVAVSDGASAGDSWGKVYIDYEIELLNPQGLPERSNTLVASFVNTTINLSDGQRTLGNTSFNTGVELNATVNLPGGIRLINTGVAMRYLAANGQLVIMDLELGDFVTISCTWTRVPGTTATALVVNYTNLATDAAFPIVISTMLPDRFAYSLYGHVGANGFVTVQPELTYSAGPQFTQSCTYTINVVRAKVQLSS